MDARKLRDSAAQEARSCLSVIERANPWHERSYSPSAVKLSIVMPVYNEEKTILRAVDEILSTDYPCSIELIVVDDGSTDRTTDLLEQVDDPRMVVHKHSVNKGKGAALRTAATVATGSYIVPFDADMEYVAADIPRLLDPIMKGRSNVVYGTRLFGCNTVYQSYRYALGNRVLTFLTNILFNANISDLHTCLKLIPTTVLREVRFREMGFGLDTEITAYMLRVGVRPFEVPISYYSRSHAEGKKINWRDGVKCVRILLRVRLWGRSCRGTADGVDECAVHRVPTLAPPPQDGNVSQLPQMTPELEAPASYGIGGPAVAADRPLEVAAARQLGRG